MTQVLTIVTGLMIGALGSASAANGTQQLALSFVNPPTAKGAQQTEDVSSVAVGVAVAFNTTHSEEGPVQLRAGLRGPCSHCNVPVCSGGCKCDTNCACIAGDTEEARRREGCAGGGGSDCIEAVNKYRAKAGRGAISSCSGSQVDLANSMAAWDSAHGFHNWVGTKGWSGVCRSGTSGQCEARGQGDQDRAVQAYYNEGPSGGHYKIMMQASSCVACGQSGSFYTHNFC